MFMTHIIPFEKRTNHMINKVKKQKHSNPTIFIENNVRPRSYLFLTSHTAL